MMASSMSDWAAYPLTAERWADFERLFGERGAYGGCWCMWWRIRRAAFRALSGSQRKAAMRTVVAAGEIPGLLAYAGAEPIAWCSLGPREHFPALGRSRTLQRPGDEPVWSIVCFFVAAPYRRQGVARRLLRDAVAYALAQGARTVEAYPVAPGRERRGTQAVMELFPGPVAAYHDAGFVTVRERPLVVRYDAAGAT
jgi:GNAT superfamily N-acetyltransferase